MSPATAFFAGIGGTGMAPLALHLAARGWTIRGADDDLAPEAAAVLRAAGINPAWTGPLPPDTQLLVHSSALRPAHPRRVEAARLGIPALRRGDLLARAAEGRRLIAVAGAHGKTTTTALLITALLGRRAPIGWALGGFFRAGGPAPGGDLGGPWLVAEVDESDGTLEGLSPEITVCTSVDWDHSDFYPTEDAYRAAFARLFARTRGAVLIPASCAGARAAAAGVPADRLATFGEDGDFALRAALPAESGQEIRLGGRFPCDAAHVPATGVFNARNACAALAAAHLAGFPVAPDDLAGFAGVHRRQAVLFDGVPAVIEDYAHHPAEIAALVGELRRRCAGRPLALVFQPHRFSRTLRFREAFARELAAADRLALLEVYGAGEEPVEGGTSADLALACAAAGRPCAVLDSGADADRALDELGEGAGVLAFVGAGTIDRVARRHAGVRRARDPFGPVRGRLRAETVLRRSEPLAARTTLGVGGPAEWYAEPCCEDDLREVIRAAHAAHLPVRLLGRGSNLLVPDQGVRGLVVRLAAPSWSEIRLGPGGTIRAGSGARLKQICGFASIHGLTGFEFLEGIPGTIGGALVMNAGAMGGWMHDLVASIRVLTADAAVRVLTPEEAPAGYRSCPALQDAIVLDAELRATGTATRGEIEERVATLARQRRATQPREPSAGCVFRNPPGGHAGRIIDELGLKGHRVGGAEVSPVHANFIVNRGGATAGDVIALIREVRETVRAQRGVVLEPEVLLFGGDWKEVLR